MLYCKVSREENSVPRELDLNADGTLDLATLDSRFTGAAGLEYRTVRDTFRCLKIVDGKIQPPEDGWGDRTYVAFFRDALNGNSSNGDSTMRHQSPLDYASSLVCRVRVEAHTDCDNPSEKCKQNQSASCVLASHDYALTAAHACCIGTNSMFVTSQTGKELPVTCVRTHELYDVGVLRLSEAHKFNFPKFYSSGDPEIGKKIFAVGFPTTFDRPLVRLNSHKISCLPAITPGRITHEGRRILGPQPGRFEGQFHFHASAGCESGASGGGIFSEYGRFVGLITDVTGPVKGTSSVICVSSSYVLSVLDGYVFDEDKSKQAGQPMDEMNVND